MFFNDVPQGEADPVFGLAALFQADLRPEKINLLIGVYKNEQQLSEWIPSVKRARESVTDWGVDYLPIDGSREFCNLLGPVMFGDQEWKKSHERIYSCQAVGGTGALYLGAAFLASQGISKEIAIPNMTWANHRLIFEKAGCHVSNYFYYNHEMHGFDCEEMLRSLKTLPEKTAVLLHAVCHNPTGCDPTIEEWKKISQVMREKNLIPFFDAAYQGFGDGIREDRGAIDLFMEAGHEILVAYSCSKNFSLYCQRVGALFVVSLNEKTKEKVGSQIKRIIRAIYSNPPAYGVRLVSHILKDGALRKEWEKDLATMRGRLSLMRKKLVDKLGSDFQFVEKHKGMFSFLDLQPGLSKKMIDQFAIYMIGHGRINVTGLTDQNIDRVVECLMQVAP